MVQVKNSVSMVLREGNGDPVVVYSNDVRVMHRKLDEFYAAVGSRESRYVECRNAGTRNSDTHFRPGQRYRLYVVDPTTKEVVPGRKTYSTHKGINKAGCRLADQLGVMFIAILPPYVYDPKRRIEEGGLGSQ